jgi:two-component system response regulator RegA
MELESARSVLVVDDDESLCRALERDFRRLGWRVSAETTFAGARACLREGSFDLVVVDVQLGQDSGLDLIASAIARAPSIGVVVASAYASIPLAVDAVHLGAINVVAKPITADSILSALDRPKRAHELSLPSLDRHEWEHLQRALHDSRGNISEAARRLSISRRTLQRKLQKRSPQ